VISRKGQVTLMVEDGTKKKETEVSYDVYYTEPESRERVLIGNLPERRMDKERRGGFGQVLKWARLVFAGVVNDVKSLSVSKREGARGEKPGEE